MERITWSALRIATLTPDRISLDLLKRTMLCQVTDLRTITLGMIEGSDSGQIFNGVRPKNGHNLYSLDIFPQGVVLTTDPVIPDHVSATLVDLCQHLSEEARDRHRNNHFVFSKKVNVFPAAYMYLHGQEGLTSFDREFPMDAPIVSVHIGWIGSRVVLVVATVNQVAVIDADRHVIIHRPLIEEVFILPYGILVHAGGKIWLSIYDGVACDAPVRILLPAPNGRVTKVLYDERERLLYANTPNAAFAHIVTSATAIQHQDRWVPTVMYGSLFSGGGFDRMSPVALHDGRLLFEGVPREIDTGDVMSYRMLTIAPDVLNPLV